jgi:hypothetical protein
MGYSVKMETLCRVSPNTLGKEILFAECQYSRHSRKDLSMLPVAMTTIFFAEYLLTLGKVFVECSIKCTQRRSRCRCTVRRAFFVVCYTRQSLHRVFSRL